MASCEVNQIFLGEVAAVQNYGAFVRIPGCAQQGLIHKSQVSSSRVDDVAEVLQRGERVWCKVISINEEGKISLSMKLVNQGNGTDLDPTGVQHQKDEQKRKSFVPGGQRKVIQLQAVLNTTCGKCGTHGHLSSDCFMSPDGKTYELIPEIEEEDDEEEAKVAGKKEPELEEPVDPRGKKHKSKKSKSKKKSKRSRSEESDSDSEDSAGKKSAKKRAREKRKERKKDKKKNCSTDDDEVEAKNSLKRKSSEHGRERRTKKCKYSSSKR